MLVLRRRARVATPVGKDRPVSTDGSPVRPDPGYWTLADLSAYMRCSRWTVARRVKADPGFPVLHGFGGPRFPIERVKAYLQRAEQGRGRAYKTRGFLSLAPQVPAMSAGEGAEPAS